MAYLSFRTALLEELNGPAFGKKKKKKKKVRVPLPFGLFGN